MEAIGQKDTGPEMRLRRALWHSGYRYRVNKVVDGARPDLVFLGPKIAVFVDGCFWHGCPDHYKQPSRNTEFWAAKLRRNKERDRRDTHRLEQNDWAVLRFWECEINDELERVVREVTREVEGAEC